MLVRRTHFVVAFVWAWMLVPAIASAQTQQPGGPPPNVQAIAWAGQLQWLLVIWGYWLDRHRAVRA